MSEEQHACSVVLASIVRLGGDPMESCDALDDAIAREEPLEIRIAGVPVAVVMRTPGDDRALVAGFLLSERIIATVDDIADIRACPNATRATDDAREDDNTGAPAVDNVYLVRLRDHVEVDLAKLQRHLFASSSCGICGKATIAAACAVAPPRPARRVTLIDAAVLCAATADLRVHQPIFAATGGVHGVLLCNNRGDVVATAEDVGRHNAIDKVIGTAALAGTPPVGHILVVSGRISFEVVQKAAAVGIDAVIGVSAPTSLAVDLARASDIVLLGFARNGSANVYAGAERIRASGSPRTPAPLN